MEEERDIMVSSYTQKFQMMWENGVGVGNTLKHQYGESGKYVHVGCFALILLLEAM